MKSHQTKTFAILLSLGILTTPLSAFAITGLYAGALGGLNVSQFSFSPAPSGATMASGKSFAGGVAVGFPIMPLLGLEVDAVMAQQALSMDVSTTAAGYTFSYSADMKMNHLQIPVLVRFGFLDMFSVGAGLFYAMGLGDISSDESISVTNGGATVQSTSKTTTVTYDKAKMSKSVYGAIASGTFMYSFMPMLSAGVDLRYLMGLNNLYTGSGGSGYSAGTKITVSNFQALASVRLSI